MRKKMPRRLDKKIFRKTVGSTKKINVEPTIYRGGIRL